MARTRNLKQTVTIKRNEAEPETYEIMADAIVQISKAFEKINASRLKRRVLVLLIHDAVKKQVGIPDIEKILDIVPVLENIYLKPGGKK